MSKAQNIDVINIYLVFILASSPLHHAIGHCLKLQERYEKEILTSRGLRFKPNSVKEQKTAQFHLSHFFPDQKHRVI